MQTGLELQISIRDQRLQLRQGDKILRTYPVSTSKFGVGMKEGSFKTPTGRFRIAEKIGGGAEPGTIFKGRQAVPASDAKMSDDDLILSRILWLEGLDEANANTRERFIYIHGTNHEEEIGSAASHGCIRMKSADLIELFERVEVNTPVRIDA